MSELEDGIEKTNYCDPSGVANFYLNHVAAMVPVEAMPAGKSLAVPLEGYSLSLLRDLAAKASVGKKALVVIAWPTGYEVQRLPDGSCTKLFYRYLNQTDEGDQANELSDTISEVKRVVQEYVESSFEKCVKYDVALLPEVKEANVVSYAYIQRRVANLKAFRNAHEGSTKRFKATIEAIIGEGYLTEVDKDKYKTSAKLYKVEV